MKTEQLDRFAPLFAPPERSYDAFLRRRSRKRRNEKIVVLAVVAVITLASGLLLRQVFVTSQRTPADTVNVSNVDRLELAWSAPSNGSLFTPTISNGVVYVASYGIEYTGGAGKRVKTGRVYAYPTSCATGGSACSPLWYGSTHQEATPFVAGNSVFALTSSHGERARLFRFPVGCASDGSECAPTWSRYAGTSTGAAPIVYNDTVYVGSSKGVLAFATKCDAGRPGACGPVWIAHTDLPVKAIARVGDTIVAGTSDTLSPFTPTATRDRGAIYAFPAACSKRCAPTWTDRSVGQVFSINVAGDSILVGTNGGEFLRPALYVYPTSCATSGACKLLWTADMHHDCCISAVGDGTQVYAVDYDGLFAYPADCRADGGSCEPSWQSSPDAFPRVDTPGPLIESGIPTIGDGVVFVSAGLNSGEVYAFTTDCTGSCNPVWKGVAGTGAYDTAIDGDHMFVAGEDGLYAFAPGAGVPPSAGSSAGVPIFYGVIALAGIAVVVMRLRARRRRHDPSADASETPVSRADEGRTP